MELRERKPPTLKEKFSDHYKNRDFTVKKTQINTIGVAFFWGMWISLFIEGHILTFQLYGDNWIKTGVIFVLIWFSAWQSFINWFGTYLVDVSKVDAAVKEKHHPGILETPTGWYNCPNCQVDVPPRSFHCKYCNKCVLKRDHHCFFTNSCIGFYNERFFIIMCISLIWCNAFASFLQVTYLNQTIPLSLFGILNYFAPVAFFQMLFGNMTFFQFFLTLHLFFTVGCFFSAIFFTYYHLFLICYGMTSFESTKKMNIYSHDTVLDNLRSVFGALRWIPLQFIFPFRVDQIDDGVNWNIRKRVKGN
ncbi:palmitoyltransferase ZDHHC22-like [Mytilus edulis]|uniref:palmitoyltransferase ZDHHC22-like n=1 Tax=Mytilus edulis TaxID=6550 RepID=UPI0039EE5715